MAPAMGVNNDKIDTSDAARCFNAKNHNKYAIALTKIILNKRMQIK